MTINELPLSETRTPTNRDDLVASIEQAHRTGTAVYPIGGGTCLDYGLPAKTSGIGLSLKALNQVVDYPARDMTITVQAGITMGELTRVLASERQQLPVDIPQSDRATLGGVIATNWNGPRRYGLGSLRDYVIGIHAVDGRGMPFKGGGRVVKNVAGYDFCKLLTGSFGILGVIEQVTLRVRPLPEQSLLLAAAVDDDRQAEQLLAALPRSQVTPVSITLLSGPAWQADAALSAVAPGGRQSMYVVAGLEGSALEVEWMQQELLREWNALGIQHTGRVEQGFIESRDGSGLWTRLVEWPAVGESPLVVKASVRPSGVVPFLEAAREVDPNCSLLSHAGNGVVFVKFSQFPKAGLSRALIGGLQPAAASHGGNVVILSNPSGADMTRQSVWGGNEGSLELMRAVKRSFDPKGILNPGRFVV